MVVDGLSLDYEKVALYQNRFGIFYETNISLGQESPHEIVLHFFAKQETMGVHILDERGYKYETVRLEELRALTWQGVPIVDINTHGDKERQASHAYEASHPNHETNGGDMDDKEPMKPRLDKTKMFRFDET